MGGKHMPRVSYGARRKILVQLFILNVTLEIETIAVYSNLESILQ